MKPSEQAALDDDSEYPIPLSEQVAEMSDILDIVTARSQQSSSPSSWFEPNHTGLPEELFKVFWT